MKSLLPRRDAFEGGLELPSLVFPLHATDIQEVPAPDRIAVPLTLSGGERFDMLVKPGASVNPGEPIAIIDPDVFVVRAPYGGRLEEFGRIDTSHACGVPAAVITVDAGNHRLQTLESIDRRDIEHIVRRAHQAGIIDMCDPPTPLGALLRVASGDQVDTLIINAMDFEPGLDQPGRALADHLDAVMTMAAILHELLAVKRTWLCVDKGDRALWPRVRSACRQMPVRCRRLRNRYPQPHPVLLTLAITSREVPPSRPVTEAGVCVLDVRSLVALHEGCFGDRPPLGRVVAVTGAVERPGYYRTAVGVSCRHVLKHAGLLPDVSRVIDGRMLTGRSLSTLDVVVSPLTDALITLSLANDQVPTPGPCIRCGWCQEDCPVGLDPLILLNRYEGRRNADNLHPQACIACGLCSYVCPSELPLTHAAVVLRQEVLCRGNSTA